MDPTSRLIHALESLAATPSGPPIAPPQARWEVQVAGAACQVRLLAGWPLGAEAAAGLRAGDRGGQRRRGASGG